MPTATATPSLTPTPTRPPLRPLPAVFNTPHPDESATVRLAKPFSPDDGEVSFHVRDGTLGTIHSCVATWKGLRSGYEGLDAVAFNLRSGAPEPEVFSTNDGCNYDEHSRIVTEPVPEAFDDGLAALVSYEPVSLAENEELRLYSRVEAGSHFEVRYFFHVVDVYDADAKRAQVTSLSDREGEWAAIREVASETDSAPSSNSNLYMGIVKISRSPDARETGDGSVWVPDGEGVSVAYIDKAGDVRATSDTSPPASPTPVISPTPTNVPGLYGDPYPTPTPTIVPGPPKRKVTIKFAETPARSGETVVFFLRDNHLGTTKQCSISWTDIPDEVEANSVWDIVSGAPFPDAFSNEGCGYDASTPLAINPRTSAFVNGLEYQINLDPRRGRVFLLNDVDAGSIVRVDFHYEVVDAFPANARRVRIYSSSDREGEWVPIREVASETDDSPAAASYLYRGEIEISEDPASLAPGDGRVRVRSRSRLSVAYYDGVNLTDPEERISLGLDLPTPTPHPRPTATASPTPTPIPAVSPLLLLLGVCATVLVVVYGRIRRPPPKL